GFLLRQSRLNKELQQLVSATRMVPVSDISNRLQRAVRQASRATGNAAELVIDHRNLMMDGDVLNKLVDPLLHILRNAVDHGMSQADEGTEPGRITVRFHQEGSNVVISCTDNGRGLNYQRIREVAIEKGLIRHDHDPSKEELARFIMSPAFTTRSSTTQVSGRGIGMDAVFSAVMELKGTISAHDVEPHGTEFIIRLPLSLVTTHSLVVQSGANIYAIPSATLAQILSPGTGEIRSEGNDNSFLLDGEKFSMHPLAAMLGYESGTTLESSTILLTSHDTLSTAIAVDAVLQSTELVIKRLGRFVPKVTGVAGVTVLGDGRVIPVLDLPELLLAAQEGTLTSSTSMENRILRPAVERPTALVVDDSLSARNSLSQLLEDTGYAVLTARDGVEAVELLQVKQPLVVLADLEMPRMDGIELTRHIRSNEKLQQLPVLMITSRSQKKHRQEAESAGVNAYLTKPFKEDELIDVVASLV
ncbi:MAG: response regulator, partial [Gammaproteobacteria bacterium]|nr:response regulator [Gammaproteobacteria bacterium]NIR96436.1 response regulator [Gammaproteobacteria bacterium]